MVCFYFKFGIWDCTPVKQAVKKRRMPRKSREDIIYLAATFQEGFPDLSEQ